MGRKPVKQISNEDIIIYFNSITRYEPNIKNLDEFIIYSNKNLDILLNFINGIYDMYYQRVKNQKKFKEYIKNHQYQIKTKVIYKPTYYINNYIQTMKLHIKLFL